MAVATTHLPVIYVVTPCLNAAATIDRTLQSVLSQAGSFHLNYHVQDAESSDGTWERIQWWQTHVDSSNFIRNCTKITFTAGREKDFGLYDAIVKAFQGKAIPPDAFMSWINADDILFPGALALVADVAAQFPMDKVSWISGATALIKSDRLISYWDSPRPTAALRAGLCDGTHWEFLQQEGGFFRSWLWESVSPNKWLPQMKLAGDWNLWRLFAHQANLVQCNYPTGAFRIRSGQLSAAQRDKYLGEIDSILPSEERKKSLAQLVENGPVVRRICRSHYPHARLFVYEEQIHQVARERFHKVFGQFPAKQFSYPQPKLLFSGPEHIQPLEEPSTTPQLPAEPKQHPALIVHDAEWQTPAITEKHAYNILKASWRPNNASPVYIAFPWATAIDHIQCGSSRAPYWLNRIGELSNINKPHPRVATVCQHIKLKEHIELFEKCGVTDIFWSHTTKQDTQPNSSNRITFHPFPLFPVHCASRDYSIPERNVLYSFVGAVENPHYLSDARQLIVDVFSNIPDSFVRSRESWHYTGTVYGEQIRANIPPPPDKSEMAAREVEYREALARSIFALCPSGSGPNSIRLWEALGSGAIPVVISDSLALPGPLDLWKGAVVFCKEEERAIKKLPAHLKALANDVSLLERKRAAARQLWLKYGTDGFVYDLLGWLVENCRVGSAASAVDDQLSNEGDLISLVHLSKAICSGKADPRIAGNILWRGLFTRLSCSPNSLREKVIGNPELLSAARMTKDLIPKMNSALLVEKVVAAFPELK